MVLEKPCLGIVWYYLEPCLWTGLHSAQHVCPCTVPPPPTVVVVDPGIKVDKGYAAWDNGLKDGVFVRVSEWSLCAWSLCAGEDVTQTIQTPDSPMLDKLRVELMAIDTMHSKFKKKRY